MANLYGLTGLHPVPIPKSAFGNGTTRHNWTHCALLHLRLSAIRLQLAIAKKQAAALDTIQGLNSQRAAN